MTRLGVERKVSNYQFRRKNHYVSCGYLKRWADSASRVWCYRILVPHEKVPLWKSQTIGGIAFHEHLYTQLISGNESDAIERWFNHEFESPADVAIEKAVSGSRLTVDDWRRIIQFVALQDVRTPARLNEFLKRWQETLPSIVQETMDELAKRLGGDQPLSEGLAELNDATGYLDSVSFPGKLTVKPGDDPSLALVGFETAVGRGLWLFSLKHLLTKVAMQLHEHRWTILLSPENFDWLTSDNPVVKLNFHQQDRYDFSGGWASPGTEIFMPLGPRHLLYAKVGSKPPRRGTVVSQEQAVSIQKFISENSHRFIFGLESNSWVPQWRPRIVNNLWFADESERWRQWHSKNVEVERGLERVSRL